MEADNPKKIRENNKNETLNLKKLIEIYLIGYKNKSCPPSFYIILFILIILIIVIIIILIL